jgi:hypothetical protein
MAKSIRVLIIGAGLNGLAVLTAWASQGFRAFAGWEGFLAVTALSAAVVWLGFLLLRREELPGWLAWLVIGAAVLRLGVGIFWTLALPEWGYPNEVQQAGYVMFDPYLRDGQAWALAQSEEPLRLAFEDYTSHDQYGGLLYISAWIYRTFAGPEHYPLMIVLLGSAASGLGVLFVWGLARRLLGGQAAALAAWGLALYPEAVLHGSSQMREAFTITLGAAAAYFLMRWWEERRSRDLVFLAVVVAFTAALTWAYLAMLMVVLGLLLAGLLLERLDGFRPRRWQWVALVFAAGLGGYLVGYLWRLLTRMSDFQGYLTEASSGVVQAVFSRLPEALHVPFVVAYGAVRPLLPAALLAEGGSALWRWIGIWRAVGWTAALFLLVLATVHVIWQRAWLRPVGMLLWVNWLMVLVASYRAGGDLWDNPRYRAGFAAFQLALAAWAVLQQRADRSHLLRRVLVVTGLQIFWLLIWYLPRYHSAPWSAGRVEVKVALSLLMGAAYWVWDWQRLRRRADREQTSHSAS